jgi:hypothetical protein
VLSRARSMGLDMNWAKQNELNKMKATARREARRAMVTPANLEDEKRVFQEQADRDRTVLPLAADEVRCGLSAEGVPGQSHC